MSTTLAAPNTTISSPTGCPFHDGAATLDGLMAEAAGERDDEFLNAALDLRSLMVERRKAEACLAQLFALRARLDGRHYLAFYRVRRWVQREIVAQIRPDRTSPWAARDLPLDAARLDELTNGFLAILETQQATLPQMRFVFRHAVAEALLTA
jgi:hypothetical protein